MNPFAFLIGVAIGRRRARRRRDRRMQRHHLRFVAIAAVVAGLVVGGIALAVPAGALPIIGDCKDAPEISYPDAGFGTYLGLRAPDHIPSGDGAEDPFAPDAKVSLIDTYGYGGLELPTYDLGCGGAVRDPAAAITTTVANLIDTSALFVVAFTGQISDAAAHPAFLSTFDPILTQVGTFTRDRMWVGLFSLTIIATGLYIVARARRARFAEVLSHAGWLVVILCASVFLFGAPLKAAGLFDSAIGAATNKVHDVFAASPDSPLNGGPLVSIAPVHRDVLFETWKASIFGDPTSATATKYATDLFRNSTYSWHELADIRAGRADENQLRDQKQQKWKDIADHISQEDPAAYANLQGRDGTNRIWRSLLALITALSACLFVIIAGLMSLAALVVVRLFILAFPVLAILGAFPTMRHTLARLWDYFTAAIVNAVLMAFAAGVVSLFIGALLAANVSGLLTLFLCWLVTIVAWRAVKPFRTLTSIIPGLHRDARKALKVASIATVAATGVSIGGHLEHQQTGGGNAATPAHDVNTTTSTTAPALPVREPDESHTIAGLPPADEPRPRPPRHLVDTTHAATRTTVTAATRPARWQPPARERPAREQAPWEDETSLELADRDEAPT